MTRKAAVQSGSKNDQPLRLNAKMINWLIFLSLMLLTAIS